MDAVTAENEAAPKAAAEIDRGIEGMTHASCVRRVEKALGRVPGVADVSVKLSDTRFVIASAETVRRGRPERPRPAPAAAHHFCWPRRCPR